MRNIDAVIYLEITANLLKTYTRKMLVFEKMM